MSNESENLLSIIGENLDTCESDLPIDPSSDDPSHEQARETIRLIRVALSAVDHSLTDELIVSQLNLGLSAIYDVRGYDQLFVSVSDFISEFENSIVEHSETTLSDKLDCERALVQKFREQGELTLALVSTRISSSSSFISVFGLYFLEVDGLTLTGRSTQPLTAPIPALNQFSTDTRLRMRKELAEYASTIVAELLGPSLEDGDDTSKIQMAAYTFYADTPSSRAFLAQIKAMRPREFRDDPFDFPSYLIPLAENSLRDSSASSSRVDDRRFKFAEILFLICLEHRRLEFGESHPAFAACLDAIARCLQVHQLIDASIEYLNSAYELRKASLGISHARVRETLYTLMEAYKSLNRSDDLVKLYDDVINNLKTAGEAPEGVKKMKARFVLERGDYKTAVSLYEDLSEHENLDDESRIAVLTNLGAALHFAGQDHEAVAQLEMAQKLALETGSSSSNLGKILNNLALAYVSLGDFSTGKKFLEQSLELRRVADGEDSAEFAQALNNAGELFTRSGEFSDALPLLMEALELRRRHFGSEDLSTASTMFSLASLYRNIGDLETSLRLHKDILRIRIANPKTVPRLLADSYNDIALILSERQDYIGAIEYHEKALDRMRLSVGDEHPQIALELNNLGAAWLGLNNLEKSEEYLKNAIQMCRKFFSDAHPDLSYMYNNLAEVRAQQNRLEEAVELHKSAISIRSAMFAPANPLIADSYLELAGTLGKMGDFDGAKNCAYEAIKTTNLTIQQISAIASERQRTEFMFKASLALKFLISLVAHHFTEDPDAIEICADTLLRRKAIGLEAGNVQRQALLSGKYPQLQETIHELIKVRKRMAIITLASAKELSESDSAELSSLSERQEKLESELSLAIPEMNLERQVRNISWKSVANVLPEGACLVDFINIPDYWSDNIQKYYAIVITKAPSVKLIACGESDELKQLIHSLRSLMEAALRDGTTSTTGTGIASSVVTRISEIVWKPIEQEIGHCKKLFIATDDDLSTLPFELLPVSENVCISDKYEICYLSTGRDVVGNPNSHVDEKNSVSIVIADPDYNLEDLSFISRVKQIFSRNASKPAQEDTRENDGLRKLRASGRVFSRLSGTRQEGKALGKMLQVAPWLGRDASKPRLLKMLQSPGILHIATHGFFIPRDGNSVFKSRPENPLLRSGLALAGANCWLRDGVLRDDTDDGILTAQDVLSLNLASTYLVVLSGCETGLGDHVTGEGMFGLRRAFILAGARNIVMSLWSVPDKETAIFMHLFYTNLLAGLRPSIAFSKTKESIKKQFPHPAVWSAFVFLGVGDY